MPVLTGMHESVADTFPTGYEGSTSCRSWSVDDEESMKRGERRFVSQRYYTGSREYLRGGEVQNLDAYAAA